MESCRVIFALAWATCWTSRVFIYATIL